MEHDVNREIDKMKEELIALRRDFHRYPELGWTEMRTSSIIARKLTDLGFDQVLTGDEVVHAKDRMGLPEEDYMEQCYARAQKEEGSNLEFLPPYGHQASMYLRPLLMGMHPQGALP